MLEIEREGLCAHEKKEEERYRILTLSCKLISHPFSISIEAIATWLKTNDNMRAVTPSYWNIVSIYKEQYMSIKWRRNDLNNY